MCMCVSILENAEKDSRMWMRDYAARNAWSADEYLTDEREIGERTETTKTIAVLKLAWILRRVLETCFHSDSNKINQLELVEKFYTENNNNK